MEGGQASVRREERNTSRSGCATGISCSLYKNTGEASLQSWLMHRFNPARAWEGTPAIRDSLDFFFLVTGWLLCSPNYHDVTWQHQKAGKEGGISPLGLIIILIRKESFPGAPRRLLRFQTWSQKLCYLFPLKPILAKGANLPRLA